jgi:hypothetical protein
LKSVAWIVAAGFGCSEFEVIKDGVIQKLIASLVLGFTAEAIGCPGDDQLFFRVTECDRALGTSVAERVF